MITLQVLEVEDSLKRFDLVFQSVKFSTIFHLSFINLNFNLRESSLHKAQSQDSLSLLTQIAVVDDHLGKEGHVGF